MKFTTKCLENKSSKKHTIYLQMFYSVFIVVHYNYSYTYFDKEYAISKHVAKDYTIENHWSRQ